MNLFPSINVISKNIFFIEYFDVNYHDQHLFMTHICDGNNNALCEYNLISTELRLFQCDKKQIAGIHFNFQVIFFYIITQIN